MSSRRTGLPAIVAVALALSAAVAWPAAPEARADVFGTSSLLSVSPTEQVVYAHDPAVSADGRYVVFDGDYGGLTGVWRRAVAGGPIEPVAVGPPETPLGSAELPSVSADGRYVSFTTTARLDPLDDTNSAPDVYVRDMDDPDAQPCRAPSEQEAQAGTRPPCAFTLVSAQNDSSAGLAYVYGSNRALEERSYGSVAAGRSALSADGQEVAFVTTAASDLDGTGTPALQVAVRDIGEKTTRLVSVREDPDTGEPAVNPATGGPEAVAAQQGSETYGAVFTGSGGRAPALRAPQPREAPVPVGASISGDGTTVSWMATNVALQAPMLAGESEPPRYVEPLWRRIGDGPGAPTLRVTGGSEPTSPACRQSGETVLASPASLEDPCQGPLATLLNPSSPGVVSGLEGNDDVIPRLSEDGYEVAFLANAPPVSLAQAFGLGGEQHTDLYVATMAAGLSRRQALQPLTELASGDLSDLATTAPIIDFGISPDGTEVAFTTKRTQFPLGVPAYVSDPTATAGMVELFDVDLSNETLTRVTQGFEGGPSEHPHEPTPAGEDPYHAADDGALSPSFTADGNTLVYSSTASNLVYGDGNTPPATEPFGEFDGSDVFAVSRVVFGSGAAPQYVGPPPPRRQPVPSWLLGVTASSARDGRVLLQVDVPGAGTLQATARAAQPQPRVVKPARAARRDGRRRGRSSAAYPTVASAATHVGQTALVSLWLQPQKSFSRQIAQPGGMAATVTVSFSTPGRQALREQLEVTFRRRPGGPARPARRAGRHRG